MHSDYKIKLLSMLPRSMARRMMEARYRGEVEATGEPELPELRRLVKRGDLALDVGCNLGVYAYELGRLTGRVIAFEPNPALARLVSRLRLEGVEVRQVALSSTDGSAELFVPTVDKGHGVASLRKAAAQAIGGGLRPVAVQTRRIDDLELDPVAFIKIDVEGFEEEVLAGAGETLMRDRPLLLVEIEERHNPGGLERIIRRMAELGYSTYFHHGGAWQPVDRYDAGMHQPSYEHVEASIRELPRRAVDYVNNFLFVPAGKVVEGIH